MMTPFPAATPLCSPELLIFSDCQKGRRRWWHVNSQTQKYKCHSRLIKHMTCTFLLAQKKMDKHKMLPNLTKNFYKIKVISINFLKFFKKDTKHERKFFCRNRNKLQTFLQFNWTLTIRSKRAEASCPFVPLRPLPWRWKKKKVKLFGASPVSWYRRPAIRPDFLPPPTGSWKQSFSALAAPANQRRPAPEGKRSTTLGG